MHLSRKHLPHIDRVPSYSHHRSMTWITGARHGLSCASQSLRGIFSQVEDGARVDLNTTLQHHLGEIAVADAVLAVPADAQQDDLDRKAAAFEQGQQDGSSDSRLSLHRQG
jgi:hypothetical protein